MLVRCRRLLLAACLVLPALLLEGPTPTNKPVRTDRDGDPLPPLVVARLGTTRFRAQSGSPTFLVSPDGKTFALADLHGVSLLDARTGVVRQVLREEEGESNYPLCFSPDNRLLVVDSHLYPSKYAEYGWRIRVWEVTTGRQLWASPTSWKKAVTGHLSSDGKAFISWGADDGLRVWELASGKLLRRLPLPPASQWFNTAASRDGRFVAAPVDERMVGVWDVTTGKEVRTFPRGRKPSDRLLFFPDGRRLVATDEGGKAIHLWDVQTGKEVLVRPREEFPSEISLDGTILLTTKEKDTTLSAWDTATGKELWSFQSEDGFAPIALSPDNHTFAVVEGQVIVVRDLRTGKQVQRCAGSLAWDTFGRWAIAFSPDGQVLIARDHHALRFWAAATGEELGTPPGHLSDSGGMAFSADGRRLAVKCCGLLHVWETDTGKPVQTFRGYEGRIIGSLALSGDGRVGAAYGIWLDPALRVWDVDTGQERYRFRQDAAPVGKGAYGVLLSFSSDGSRLAVASELTSRIGILDAATGKLLRVIDQPERVVEAIAFSPDGATLAVWSEKSVWLEGDNFHSEVGLWDADTGAPVGPPLLPAGGEITFSGDGRLLATLEREVVGKDMVKETVVRVWELASGKAVADFRRDWDPDSRRRWAVTFTPSGEVLAAVIVRDPERRGTETAVELWELLAGKRIRRLEMPWNWFEDVAFAPDGTRLATAMADTSILIWEPSVLAAEGRRGPTQFGVDELNRLWEDLAGSDAEQAQRAVRTLCAAPESTIPFLNRRLSPAGAGRFPRLIADLDADSFAVREAASRELARGGPSAAALRAALRSELRPEPRRRIENLLAVVTTHPLPPELLRQVRAVQLLEQIATPAASRLLEDLAGGASDARLTQEAVASLQRLRKRVAVKP
jgi:WD40 repeat protein